MVGERNPSVKPEAHCSPIEESGNLNIVANLDGFGDFLLPKLLHQFLNRLH